MTDPANPSTRVESPGAAEPTVDGQCSVCQQHRLVYRRDPIANLLFDRAGVRALRVAVAVAVIVAVVNGGLVAYLAASNRLAALLSRYVGVRVLFVFALMGLVITPLVWVSYHWIHGATARLFQRLIHGRVLEADADTLHQLTGPDGDIGRLFGQAGWSWASATVSLSVAILYLAGVIPVHPFTRSDSWPFLVANVLVWAASWYAGCQIAARQMLTIMSLRLLFRGRRLTLQPLHPDRCGGLGPLRDYSIRFASILGMFALLITLVALLTRDREELLHDSTFAGFVLLYLAVSPTMFFGMLALAHEQMRDARDRLLARVSASFGAAWSELESGLANGHTELRDKARKHIDELREIHDIAAAFPVWPFDAASVRRYFATLTAPLLAMGVAILQDYLVRLFAVNAP